MSEVDVQARAEGLVESLVSFAGDLPRANEDMTRSERRWVELSDPWRYWQVRTEVYLAAESAMSPVDLAEEMIRSLTEDGWVTGPGPEAQHGVRATLSKEDVGGRWTVVVVGGENPSVPVRRVSVWAVSPEVDH